MTKRSICFFVYLGIFSAGFFVFSAEPVSAHATPITYDPEASAVLNTAPERVRIYFSERVDPAASSIKIFAPDGSIVGGEDALVDPSDAHYFRCTLRSGNEGTYTVSWQVVSADDGHFTKGAFNFSVGKISTASVTGGAQFEISHRSSRAQGLAVALELIGYALLWGVLIVYVCLVYPLRKIGLQEHADIVRHFTQLLLLGASLVIFGALFYILSESRSLAVLQERSLTEGFFAFSRTISGTFAWYRGALGVLIFLLALVVRKRLFSETRISYWWWVFLVLFLVLAVARVRASHATASLFWPAFTFFDHLVQLIAKGIWAGSLFVFGTGFFPLLMRMRSLHITAVALTSFSKLVSIVFALTALSGAYVVWLDLKTPENLLITDWGVRFIVLSIVAGALFTLRLFHQALVDRAAVLACRDGAADGQQTRALQWFRLTFPLEALLGLALLVGTAFSMITTPPFSQSKLFVQTQESRDARLVLTEHPYEDRMFQVVAEEKESGKPAFLSQMVVTLTNVEQSIGPIVADTERRSWNSFVFSEQALSPPGSWKIDIAAQREGKYDAVASFTVQFPDEVQALRLSSENRVVDVFTFVVASVAGASLLFALVLFFYSRHLRRSCLIVSSKSIGATTSFLAFPTKREWVFAFFLLMIFAALLLSFENLALKSNFQRLCERDGNMWHVSVPIREGRAVGQIASPGCHVQIQGTPFHFIDEQEYRYTIPGR